jgi:hypothetical protein
MLAVSGEQCGLSGDMVLTYSLHQIEHTNYDDRNSGSFLQTSVSTTTPAGDIYHRIDLTNVMICTKAAFISLGNIAYSAL